MGQEWRTRQHTRRTVIGAAAGATATALLSRQVTLAEDTDARVEALLSQLPLEDKVSQLFVFEARGTTMTPDYADRLTRERPGGVIFVAPNIGALADVGPFVTAIHATNPMLPPLIGIDQEGGLVSRLPNDPAPSAPELGHRSDAEVADAAEARSLFLRTFNFDVNFAPVADIAFTATSTMAGRSFGSDPGLVASKVAAMVEGAKRTRLLSAAKHFPGHGRTSLDSHAVLPEVTISRDEWWQTDGLPFRVAVESNVGLMMVGHLLYPRWDAVPTSLSPVAVSTLRTDLAFPGVIVTDDLGMGALAAFKPFEVIDRAVDAGVDLLLYATPTAEPAALIGHLVERVNAGIVAPSRIDESVRRILRLKVNRFGL